jgi:hypothetical protein
MSSFSAKGLTNKGRALQAKAQAGVELVYTKAVIGDGNLGNQSIGPLTNVISAKKTYPLTRFNYTGNMASIGFDLTNQDVTTGFYFREIGIFATDPDEGEILYWYANAGDTDDYIPPGGGSDVIEKTFDVLVFVGSSVNVSAVINESLIYATVEGLEEAMQTAKDYTDSKFSQIIIQDASTTQKGVVQLSNSTTSTSQTLAATAKAVSDARQAAISAAATDATTKANTAETNAKNQADAKFRTPAQINRANLLKNSSGLMDFQHWTKVTPGWTVYTNPTVGRFFSQDGAVASGQYAVLDSEVIGVFPGPHYLQAMFHTSNSGPNAIVTIEIKNAANDQTINSIPADTNTWWHRKSSAINIPTGVSAIKIRLVVSNYPGGSNIGFSRIGFYEGSADIPYTQEFDIRALYEQNEVVKQSGVDAKNGIVGAINAKGGSASTSDTWPTLIDKVNTIQTGPKYATGTVSRTTTQHKFTLPNGDPAYDRFKITVTGLSFRPNRIIVYSQGSPDRSVIGIYDRGSLSAGGYSFTKLFEAFTVSTYRLFENSANGGVDEAWVSDQGFQLPMYSTNTANSTITWEAFRV